MDYFYDGWMHFLGLQNHAAHSGYFIFDCVRLKEDSHIHLGWLEGE